MLKTVNIFVETNALFFKDSEMNRKFRRTAFIRNRNIWLQYKCFTVAPLTKSISCVKIKRCCSSSPANTCMLSAMLVVICRSCTRVTRPRGNTTTMSTSLTPNTLLMAEPPVSPDVPETTPDLNLHHRTRDLRRTTLHTYYYRGPCAVLAQKVLQELSGAGHGQILKGQRFSMKQFQDGQRVLQLDQSHGVRDGEAGQRLLNEPCLLQCYK